VIPEELNAVKFERFVFDLLPQARGAIVMEVDRATSFAPVKNAPGEAYDTPEAAQAQLSALHAGWLRECGLAVPPNTVVEISPLAAGSAEELREKLAQGTLSVPVATRGSIYLK
jgi:UDP-N-acetylglucosamine/UDP-N-acetylgalactosamine diphosphorylase